ncbi:MAG: hypothetical protein HQL69_14915 [Magnetococcales bacterium]|nr:hypothetical protein [Magnetococcales bacterium]
MIIDQEESIPNTGLAINMVLQAEKETLQAISQSREEAEALVLAAQHKEAQISARADKRISKIIKKRSKKNKKYLNKAKKREARISQQEGEVTHRVDLEKIVQILAARLTHGEPLQMAVKK